jgi:peroxiredoxin
LRSESSALTDKGATILTISAEDPEDTAGFVARNLAPFPLLSDSDRAVMKAYDVHNALSFEGFNIAHPAVFLIDPAGVVRWRFVGSNQMEWPQTGIVAEKLAGLQASGPA